LTRTPGGRYIARCFPLRFKRQLHYQGTSMKNAFVRCICRALIVCMGAFSFTAQAGMVGADELAGATQAVGARDKVRDFIGRGEVRGELEAGGISATAAQDRVNRMTDAEAASIAGRIDQLPAGGISGWAALATLSIVGLIWYYWVK
jgi:hypothetical protein